MQESTKKKPFKRQEGNEGTIVTTTKLALTASPSSSTCSLCSRHTDLPASLECGKLIPVPGPLYLLFPLPGMRFPLIMTWLVPFLHLALPSNISSERTSLSEGAPTVPHKLLRPHADSSMPGRQVQPQVPSWCSLGHSPLCLLLHGQE